MGDELLEELKIRNHKLQHVFQPINAQTQFTDHVIGSVMVVVGSGGSGDSENGSDDGGDRDGSGGGGA